MLMDVLLGMLAAYGTVCALWVSLGALLCRGRVTALCTRESEGRGRWLRGMGLVSDVVLVPEETIRSEETP